MPETIHVSCPTQEETLVTSWVVTMPILKLSQTTSSTRGLFRSSEKQIRRRAGDLWEGTALKDKEGRGSKGQGKPLGLISKKGEEGRLRQKEFRPCTSEEFLAR